MKRVLSLVLALSLVLGSIPAGFAATPTAGETLKGYGLLAGDQSGNLNEDKEITRGEMMVVLARLLGKFDEAKAYSIPSTSKDVAGHWAAAYIAFAEKEAWTSGKGNGMFDPNGKVTLQETAAFMMKALGYTVTDFSKVVEEATKLNVLKDVKGEATKAIVRADLFTAALNTINTPSKDSTQKLGEKLGVIKVVASALDPKSAAGVSHNTMSVSLNKEATAVVAADFSVVDKDGKALEVKEAKLISAKTVWITTADQTAGKIYTVKVAGKSYTVTGLQKDASLPEVDKAASRVLDNNTVLLVFTKKVDPRNALVAANYTFTNGLTASAVEYGKDKDGVDVRTKVYVTTSAQETNKLYKITVGAAVTDFYGNKVQTEDDKNFFNFVGLKADTAAPKIKSVIAENGQKVVVTFDEKSDMDKTNALNPANYVFVNKTDATKTLTATAVKFQTGIDPKTTVFVTTSAQVEKNSYELTINNVTDKFGNTLVDNKRSFAGAPLDKTAPKIKSIQTASNTMIKVTFTENVTAETAVVAANYTVDKDLAVTAAVVDSADDAIVWLTTSAQKSGTQYKLTINNVADEYGNAIAAGTQIFVGTSEDTTKPVVKNAYAFVDGSTYVKVIFNVPVKESTAKTASNYYFGSTIGYGISVEKKSDVEFDVKVNPLEDNKLYTLTVSGVESLAGIVVDYENNEKQFLGKVSADTAAPKLTAAVTIDKRTVKLVFDKAMNDTALKTVTNYTFTRETDSSTFTAPTILADGTDTDTTADGISVATDKKSVTLRMTTDVFADYNSSSTEYKVTLNAALKGLNNAAVDTAYNSKSFWSTNVAPRAVEIASVTPIDEYTVDVKFNQNIKTATPTLANVKITKDGAVTSATVVAVTRTDADLSVVRIATSTKLEAGAKYTVKFEAGAAEKITDSFQQLALAANASDYFYGSSNTYVAPNYLTYTAGPVPGSLEVTFNKEISAVDVSKVTIGGVAVLNRVIDGSKVTFYFDNAGKTVGKTYELVIGKDAITDLSQKKNDEMKLPFGISSATRSDVVIDGVTIAQTLDNSGTAVYNTLTILINKEVKGFEATGADFVIYTSAAGVAVDGVWGTALTAGTGYTLTQTNGVAMDTDYYSMVTIKLTTAVTSTQSIKVDLAAGSDLTSYDGATKPSTTTPVIVVVK